MEITTFKYPIPEWDTAYAQDFITGDDKILHGVYLRLPDGLSHWILDADSADEATKIATLINVLAKTYNPLCTM